MVGRRGRKNRCATSSESSIKHSCSGRLCQVHSSHFCHILSPISLHHLNMFPATAAARSMALRSRSLRVSFPLQHTQPQSTFSGTDNYWQRIKPWKDVSAEEFISYRWQVCSRALSGPAPALTTLASKHRTRHKKATQLPLGGISTSLGRISQSTIAENQDERAIHRRRCSSSQVSPHGHSSNPAHTVTHRLGQPAR